MAYVEKRGPRKYRARYRGPDGRERSRTFETRRDAERFLVSIEHAKSIGGYVDPSAGRRLFGDYARAFARSQVSRPTTAERFEIDLRVHMLPTFEHRQLASIRPSEVQAWVRALSETLAPATVEVAYKHLSAVFKAAVTDGLLAVLPCRGVKLPRKQRKLIEPLSAETVYALAEAAPNHLRAFVMIGAGAGLRPGEILGLGVEHVDTLRRLIRVERQLITVSGKPPQYAPPKTEASVRTVPVPQFVIDEVAAHLARFPAIDGRVFSNRSGNPWGRSGFGTSWRSLVAHTDTPSKTRAHDLRHFYASALIRHGESVKTVQARLGHASALETLNTYAHLWPDSDDRTRDAIDAALSDNSRPARGLTATP
jgi:integrase